MHTIHLHPIVFNCARPRYGTKHIRPALVAAVSMLVYPLQHPCPIDFPDDVPIQISQFSGLTYVADFGNLAFGIARFIVPDCFFIYFRPASQSIENLTPFVIIQHYCDFHCSPLLPAIRKNRIFSWFQCAPGMDDKSTDDESCRKPHSRRPFSEPGFAVAPLPHPVHPVNPVQIPLCELCAPSLWHGKFCGKTPVGAPAARSRSPRRGDPTLKPVPCRFVPSPFAPFVSFVVVPTSPAH